MLKRVGRYAVLLFAVMAIFVSLMLLNACAALAPNPFALANTKWTLMAMTQGGISQPVVAVAPTLEFQSDTLGGNAGCNSYGGAYKTQGEMITVSTLQVTVMACADEKTMAQESAYLDALQNARTFELRGDVLKMTYGDGQGQLVYQSSR